MKTIAELRKETGLPVVVVNQQGAITSVNPAFESVFGWSREEIIGRPLTTLIPRSLHEAHALGFSRFRETGIGTLLNRPVVLKAVAKDGRVFDAEHTILAERTGDAWVFAATIKPMDPAPDAP